MLMKKVLITLALCSLVAGPWGSQSVAAQSAFDRAVLLRVIADLQAEINERLAERPVNEIELESGDQILTVYSSQSSQLVAAAGSYDPKHADYWEITRSVIPSSLTSRVHEVVFYRNEDNVTDAYVENLYTDRNDIWRLAINFANYEADPDFATAAELMIHEFGHIISLNETQVLPFDTVTECITFVTLEGCPREESYYQSNIDDFWTEELLELALDAESSSDQEAAVAEYYEAYEDYFVSEYAATNPGEDWAETFTVFVLKARPTGWSIAEQKVRSLYSYPELIDLRDQIRLNL